MAKLKRNRDTDESDGGSEEQDVDIPKVKKPKNVKESKDSAFFEGKNGKGEPYWELSSSNRRATVTKFGHGKSSTVRIDIREFYEKEGEHLPGKKGISLSVDQFNALLRAIPSISAALVKEGEPVENIGGGLMNTGAVMMASAAKRVKPKPAKANIEATSDEGE